MQTHVFHVVSGSRLIATESDFLRATVLAEAHGAELWQSRQVRRLLPAALPPTHPPLKRKRRVA